MTYEELCDILPCAKVTHDIRTSKVIVSSYSGELDEEKLSKIRAICVLHNLEYKETSKKRVHITVTKSKASRMWEKIKDTDAKIQLGKYYLDIMFDTTGDGIDALGRMYRKAMEVKDKLKGEFYHSLITFSGTVIRLHLNWDEEE